MADEASLAATYTQPLEGEAAPIECAPDERFQPSTRDAGYLAVRMRATVAVETPQQLMENYDLEQLIPAYAAMVAQERMQIVSTRGTTMRYFGMFTIGETSGVVVDGASLMTSNVTLELRMIPLGQRRGASARLGGAAVALQSADDDGVGAADAAQAAADVHDVVSAAEVEDARLVLARLDALAAVDAAPRQWAARIGALGARLRAQWMPSDRSEVMASEADAATAETVVTRRHALRAADAAAAPTAARTIGGFVPSTTTIMIGVHSSSRERVEGRVVVECPSERF